MNELETSPMNSEVPDQIAALQRQVFTLLLALIVVSGTLTVYLFQQATIARHDIAGLKPQATKVIDTYNQNRAEIQSFVQQLAAFGKTHPDFQPILKKYGITEQPAAPKK